MDFLAEVGAIASLLKMATALGQSETADRPRRFQTTANRELFNFSGSGRKFLRDSSKFLLLKLVDWSILKRRSEDLSLTHSWSIKASLQQSNLR